MRPNGTLFCAALALCAAAASTHAATRHESLGMVLAEYTTQAGAAGNSARGQVLLEQFSTPVPVSSAAVPVHHPVLEQWLAQGCAQTLGRTCSVQEKADVVAGLLSHMP